MRELHWHLGAHELGYVVAGQGRMGIFSSDGTGDTFDLQPGSISFVPEGYTHYIQNTGEETLHLILAFTQEQPGTIDLSQALPGFPQHLLAETFGVPDADFPFLATRGDRRIVPLPAPQGDAGIATPVVSASSPFTTQTEQVAQKEFVGGGGSARPVSTKDIPHLQGITLFTLQIVPHGLRDPHWHPDTSELNYCVSGRGQIGLVAPDGACRRLLSSPARSASCPVTGSITSRTWLMNRSSCSSLLPALRPRGHTSNCRKRLATSPRISLLPVLAWTRRHLPRSPSGGMSSWRHPLLTAKVRNGPPRRWLRRGP